MANTGLELTWRAPARLLRSSIAMLETLAKKIFSMEILSRHPLLLLGLVLGWFYYVFASYLPDLQLRAFEFHLRRSGSYDVCLVLWFAAVAYCTGKRVLSLIGISTDRGAEEAALSIAAGASIFSLLTLVLALVNGLYRPAGYLLLLIPSLIWQEEMKRLPGEIWRLLVTKLRSVSWSAAALGQAALAVYIVVVLGIVLLSALAPSYEFDDLVYHLAAPKNFVQHHRIVSLPDNPFVFFAKNIEMLYTLGMLWHSDITAKLINFLLAVVTLVAVYGFSVRFLSRVQGIVAVAILVSSPLWIWEMKTAHNDLGLGLYIFCGLYGTAVWLWKGGTPWLRFAGLCFAFSLGAKYWALLAVGVTILLVFIILLSRTKAVGPAASASLKLAAYSAAGLLPWGLVNLYHTGNPVFPLFNDVFQSPYWTPAHTNMARNQMYDGGIRITLSNWWELFAMWWKLMEDPRAKLGGNIGPFYVMLLPLLLLSRLAAGPQLLFLLVSSVLYYAAWAIYAPWARYLLPALPGFAAAAACGVEKLLRLLGSYRKGFAIAAAGFLIALAILTSPFFEDYGAWSRYGSRLIETMSIKYLAGWESKSDYLGRFYPEYQAVQFLNKIPGAKKVLFVGSLPDGFYLDGEAAFHYSPFYPGLVGKNSDYIHRVLRQNGITHLLVYQKNQHSGPLSSRASVFNRRYLRKLYHRDATIVYELLPHMVVQEAVAYDFLEHVDEARVEPNRDASQPTQLVGLRRIRNDTRYAMITLPPAEVEFSVGIREQAMLSFAVGKENPDCAGKGSFQVWISSPDGVPRMVYGRDLEGERGAGWIEERVDLCEYAGRRVIVTFRTEDASSCCSYLWADPVLIARKGVPVKLGPIVSGLKLTPSSVRAGGEFEATFFGPALTPETYFDLRVRAPESEVDEIVVNWQKGASVRHTIPPTTALGKWVITGVRAHDDPSDSEGDFYPVRGRLEVTR